MDRVGQFGRTGFINSHLAGRTIEALYKDGTWLIIRCTDGHEYKIGYQDAHGNQVSGEPFLENLDVRIVLPSAGFSGGASL